MASHASNIVIIVAALAVFLALASGIASADTLLSHNITINKVFVADKSPYRIVGRVVVADGVSAEFEQGSVVLFTKDSELIVRGNVTLKGATLGYIGGRYGVLRILVKDGTLTLQGVKVASDVNELYILSSHGKIIIRDSILKWLRIKAFDSRIIIDDSLMLGSPGLIRPRPENTPSYIELYGSKLAVSDTVYAPGLAVLADNGSSVSLTNSFLRGIYLQSVGGSYTSIENSTIAYAYFTVIVGPGSRAILRNNIINATKPYMESRGVLDARDNYWSIEPRTWGNVDLGEKLLKPPRRYGGGCSIKVEPGFVIESLVSPSITVSTRLPVMYVYGYGLRGVYYSRGSKLTLPPSGDVELLTLYVISKYMTPICYKKLRIPVSNREPRISIGFAVKGAKYYKPILENRLIVGSKDADVMVKVYVFVGGDADKVIGEYLAKHSSLRIKIPGREIEGKLIGVFSEPAGNDVKRYYILYELGRIGRAGNLVVEFSTPLKSYKWSYRYYIDTKPPIVGSPRWAKIVDINGVCYIVVGISISDDAWLKTVQAKLDGTNVETHYGSGELMLKAPRHLCRTGSHDIVVEAVDAVGHSVKKSFEINIAGTETANMGTSISITRHKPVASTTVPTTAGEATATEKTGTATTMSNSAAKATAETQMGRISKAVQANNISIYLGIALVLIVILVVITAKRR